MKTVLSFPLAGVFTALVTPMSPDGQIHWDDLKYLVERQIAAGVQGLVVLGTTAETATLSFEEQLLIVQRVAQWTQKGVPLIVGGGCNNTQRGLERIPQLEQAGSDAFLWVTPYYNRPSQAGLFEHFRTLAQATALPWILYTVPARCGVSITVETVSRLVEACPNLVGLKESSGSCDPISTLIHTLGNRMPLLSGDDTHTLPFMAIGASGVISVAANYLPHRVVEMVEALRSNDWTEARRLHTRYFPLFKGLLSIDSNPVPIKQALYEKKWISSPHVRLPLVGLQPEQIHTLQSLLCL